MAGSHDIWLDNKAAVAENIWLFPDGAHTSIIHAFIDVAGGQSSTGCVSGGLMHPVIRSTNPTGAQISGTAGASGHLFADMTGGSSTATKPGGLMHPVIRSTGGSSVGSVEGAQVRAIVRLTGGASLVIETGADGRMYGIPIAGARGLMSTTLTPALLGHGVATSTLDDVPQHDLTALTRVGTDISRDPEVSGAAVVKRGSGVGLR